MYPTKTNVWPAVIHLYSNSKDNVWIKRNVSKLKKVLLSQLGALETKEKKISKLSACPVSLTAGVKKTVHQDLKKTQQTNIDANHVIRESVEKVSITH